SNSAIACGPDPAGGCSDGCLNMSVDIAFPSRFPVRIGLHEFHPIPDGGDAGLPKRWVSCLQKLPLLLAVWPESHLKARPSAVRGGRGRMTPLCPSRGREWRGHRNRVWGG